MPQRGEPSVFGVYGGLVDTLPASAWMNRSLTLHTGPCHVQGWVHATAAGPDRARRVDPARVITRQPPLGEAPHGCYILTREADGCEKVVLKP